MAVEIVMPRLSDSMEEGTVAKWLVGVGDAVEKGQVLVEIDTDKATMEYEAEQAGTLLAILVSEGEVAAIGAPIAQIGSPGEEVKAPAPPVATAPARPAEGRSNASPIARRLAKELGVDLSAIQGSGPGGMISREDVEAAADGAAKPGGRVEPLTRVQQAVVRHMNDAAAVPTFATEVEVDMTACAELRAPLDPRPSFNDLVVKACALALRDHPRVNAHYTDAGFSHPLSVNVGIAVAARDALLVPVIHDADRKPLADIASEAKELAEKARAGKLTPAELDGGTFTVSNLGMHRVRRFEALLNTPQAAILAVGAVEQRPVVAEDGQILARPLMSATLVCDHRILYGADAAVFLSRVKELLESPQLLAQG